MLPTPDQLQWVLDHNHQIRGNHRRQICDAVVAWRAVIAQRDELLMAAKLVLAHLESISQHQRELLIEGQTLESAEQNWDEATLGQYIDFQPLIDAVAKIEAGTNG